MKLLDHFGVIHYTYYVIHFRGEGVRQNLRVCCMRGEEGGLGQHWIIIINYNFNK